MSPLNDPLPPVAAAGLGMAHGGPDKAPEEHDTAVVVCTYTEERWDDLVECVQSLHHQTRSAGEIVVVVDHNPGLLARAQGLGVKAIANRYPRGLSGGRNTGVEVTRGALVAFLDDDAVASPTWLENMVAPFDDARVLGVGGLIEPLWMTDQAAWFPEEFYWVLGCTHRGLLRVPGPVRNPFGASMCMRRTIFEEVGLFRDGIGRAEGAPMGCEETELCIRARQRWEDGVFLFQPDARIQHRVPAARVRWNYFVSRCYAEGVSKALISRSVGRGAALSEERAYSTRILPLGVMRGLRDSLLGGDHAGLLRSGAIMAGLAVTTAGYLKGQCGYRNLVNY